MIGNSGGTAPVCLCSAGMKMRIAQVAPLFESVPPKMYGGTERVVSFLTEELVRAGHDVTLFASGDSITSADLVPICPEALRLTRCIDPIAHHVVMIEKVFEHKDEFDLIHFHIDHLQYSLCRREKMPNLTTLHGRLDIPDLAALFRKFEDAPVVSISDSQRDPLPWLNWQATVYHGLPENQYTLGDGQGGYLAFLGRISPEKGIDQAIEIATRVGMPLRIAAKIDRADQEYFETVVRPLMQNPLIEFIGEIGYPEKNEFLGNAAALLFPIDWPEPFGLVMIESLACGTPVIAYPRGSVPEILEHGRSGLLVKDAAAAAVAVDSIPQISRVECRHRFEERFSAARMAENYLALYQRLIQIPEPFELTDGVSVG